MRSEIARSETLHIAVVGAGAAGCYTAQDLLKRLPHARISVFEALPTPYGLVRSGVATDHQSTKRVTTVLERVLSHERVEFLGNMRLGETVSLSELSEHFDAVVVATGLDVERELGAPGGTLPGVLRSGEVTRHVNAAPGAECASVGSDVVIVGAGNVAADVLRYLVKLSEHFDGSDIDEPALTALEHPGRRVTLLSRAPAASMKVSPAMLRELGELPHVSFTVVPSIGAADAADAPVLAALAELPQRENATHHVEIVCSAVVEEIHGEDRVTAVSYRAGGVLRTVTCDTVVTAIGYERSSLEAHLGEADEAAGVFRTGWLASRGRGTLPDARTNAKALSHRVVEYLEAGGRAPRRGSLGLLHPARHSPVTFEEWRWIDAAEQHRAGPGRVRRKLRSVAEMHEVIAAGRAEQEGGAA